LALLLAPQKGKLCHPCAYTTIPDWPEGRKEIRPGTILHVELLEVFLVGSFANQRWILAYLAFTGPF
jgi:hypothetical protein